MTDANDPIPQITREDEAAGSGDLVAGNVARLKALFPEIVTDGKVDFDVLRELLGDDVEEGEERYGLNWKGKRKARAFAMTPSLGTLLPAPEDSVDWDTTQNIVVEGDNLEVLKILRRSYSGAVKLIYIDPPYNTGHDFVYPDNYRNSLSSYMAITGQTGSAGEALSSQSEEHGRFHTNWLNMMLPRLSIAKEALADEGSILISIDEAEQANLVSLCREIFGEEAYVTSLIRRRRMASGMRDSGISPDHEYVVAIAKNVTKLEVLGFEKDAADFPYEDGKGKYRSTDLTVGMGRALRPNQYYAIKNPRTGSEFWPSETRVWRFEPGTMAKHIADENIIWPDDVEGDRMARPRFKTRYESDGAARNPVSSWIERSSTVQGAKSLVSGLNEEATKQVRDLFGEQVFDYPKPLSLIQSLLRALTSNHDIVLDFFAGSGTTGHAVFAQNAEDGGARRFILVQLPETLRPTDPDQKVAAAMCKKLDKPLNIAELTKERLRRAGAKIRKEHPDAKVDTGFRVYKLATSNLKPWQPDADDLEASILDAVDNVLPGRTEEDLLVELLLKTGINLTLPEEKRSIADQTVHALGGGTLMVCLGDVGANDTEALGQGMADWVEELDPVQTTVYFKDTGLGADGNRAATKANLAAILRQRLGDRIAKIASI
ncbi:site-specific DNA-methyltransferase [Sphingomonas sp. IW22]|uniref:site-specific DNA-methyltransferase n=1 Tax=Sphingomonas sp. IW22 TaxID=3242489 RepID=UPI0035231115